MNKWQDVLNSLSDKRHLDIVGKIYNSISAHDDFGAKKIKARHLVQKRMRKHKKYPLGEHYPGIYLAQREAECIYWLLETNRYKNVSAKMDITLRTVETYIKNIRTKLRCSKKAEIIDIIKKSEFLQHFCCNRHD